MEGRMERTLPGVRVPPILGVAAAVAVGLVLAGVGFAHPGTLDTDAYWGAAMRLRAGEPLYPLIDPNARDVYRYAPWFAWLWVPLTFVPQQVAYGLWGGLLLLCTGVSVAPLFRLGASGVALAALCGGGLIYATGYGNATPLIVALLTVSRLHPVVVGIAGSLKVYPLLLTGGYVAERRWRAVAASWITAALLWAPALFYGLAGYASSPGHGGMSLWSVSPVLFGAVAAFAGTVTGWLMWRGSRVAWIGAAALILLAVPRVWPSDLSYAIPVALALAGYGHHDAVEAAGRDVGREATDGWHPA